jgi:hypothetical protein
VSDLYKFYTRGASGQYTHTHANPHLRRAKTQSRTLKGPEK